MILFHGLYHMPKPVVAPGRDWKGVWGSSPQENFGESSAKIVQF